MEAAVRMKRLKRDITMATSPPDEEINIYGEGEREVGGVL